MWKEIFVFSLSNNGFPPSNKALTLLQYITYSDFTSSLKVECWNGTLLCCTILSEATKQICLCELLISWSSIANGPTQGFCFGLHSSLAVQQDPCRSSQHLHATLICNKHSVSIAVIIYWCIKNACIYKVIPWQECVFTPQLTHTQITAPLNSFFFNVGKLI